MCHISNPSPFFLFTLTLGGTLFFFDKLIFMTLIWQRIFLVFLCMKANYVLQ